MTILFNKTEKKSHRRELRKNFTDAEKKSWAKVRNKQLGYKFYRQYSIGPYILDFFCPLAKLVIELDGGQHAEAAQMNHDEKRTDYLKKENIKVLRFWNDEVLKNTENVLSEIAKNLTPPSLPFKKGEEQ